MGDSPHDKSRRAILTGGAFALLGGWHFSVRDALLRHDVQGSSLKRDGTKFTDWFPKGPEECGPALEPGPCDGHSECFGLLGDGSCPGALDCLQQTCGDYTCGAATCEFLAGPCNGLDLCAPQQGPCNLVTCTSQNGFCNLSNCGPGKMGPCNLTNCPGQGGEELAGNETPSPDTRTVLLGEPALDEITSMPFARSMQRRG